MNKTINNLSDYGIPSTEKNVFAYLISGSDAPSNIINIVHNSFKDRKILLKASGMLEEIVVVNDYVKNVIYFDKADADKFFIKNFPEVLAIIPNENILKQIINEWLCTIYERRILYIVDEGKIQDLISILIECKFNTSICFSDVWKLVDGIVENSPEAPDHNTFVLFTKKDI